MDWVTESLCVWKLFKFPAFSRIISVVATCDTIQAEEHFITGYLHAELNGPGPLQPFVATEQILRILLIL